MGYYVEIFPLGKKIKVKKGETLLALLQRSGFNLESKCGGKGVCGRCRVILKGHFNFQRSEKETVFFASGNFDPEHRLACQFYPLMDLTIQIPEESMISSMRLQLNGEETRIHVDPLIQKECINIPDPDSLSHRCEVSRFLHLLPTYRMSNNPPVLDVSVVRFLPNVLRTDSGKITLTWRRSEIIKVEPGNITSRYFGIAVDLGTTKIGCYLLDLENGSVLSADGCINPQIPYGEDVISRGSFALESATNAKTLQRIVVSRINKRIASICKKTGIRREEISEACIVGNTIMIHLLIGISIENLIVKPYIAGNTLPLEIKARDLKIDILPGGYIYFPPGIGSFVGSDTVAMIMAANLYNTDETILAIDIGTNTEIAIVRERAIKVCSCASGPAFEGAHLSSGVVASMGAIEKVTIDQTGEVTTGTIGNGLPVGICGSGIVDSIAQMLMRGIIDEMGQLDESNINVRPGKTGEAEFELVNAEKTISGKDIVITQKDIRQVQLAKAAIISGINLLLRSSGIGESNIEKVVLAGAFGNYLDVESSKVIGLLPRIKTDKFNQIGNAAGTGARIFLASKKMREVGENVASHIEYLDLTSDLNFNKQLISNTIFPIVTH